MNKFHSFNINFYTEGKKVEHANDITSETVYTLGFSLNQKEFNIGDVYYTNNSFYVLSLSKEDYSLFGLSGIIFHEFKDDKPLNLYNMDDFLNMKNTSYVGNVIIDNDIDYKAFTLYNNDSKIKKEDKIYLSSGGKSLKIPFSVMNLHENSLFYKSNKIFIVDSTLENSLLTFPRENDYNDNNSLKDFYNRQIDFDFSNFQVSVQFNVLSNYDKDSNFYDFKSNLKKSKGIIYTGTIFSLKENDLYVKKEIESFIKNKNYSQTDLNNFFNKINSYVYLNEKIEFRMIYNKGAYTQFVMNPNNTSMLNAYIYSEKNENFTKEYLKLI